MAFCARTVLVHTPSIDKERVVTTEVSRDRVNNDLGYGKNNCRWATYREQNRNRRDNVRVTYNGETKLLVEWAEVAGMAKSTLRRRLGYGWSVEDALTKPVRRWGR